MPPNKDTTRVRKQDTETRIFDRLMAQYEVTGLVGDDRPRDKKHAISIAKRLARGK